MKGIIFTEFMELVEREFGLTVLNNILDAADDSGVYTAVGSYDHQQLLRLIHALSHVTGMPTAELQQHFGEAVFAHLLASLPPHASLIKSQTCFQFIRHVEEYIHVEVKKLYPDANPPRFSFLFETEQRLEMNYQSGRCMAHVCFGLIQGCARHFGEQIDVEMTALDESGSKVNFVLIRQAGQPTAISSTLT